MALSAGIPRREPVALLVGAGLTVALAFGLVVAVVRWIRLSRAGIVPPEHTREVRQGYPCDPPPAVSMVGPAAIAGARAVLTLVAGSRTHTAIASVTGTADFLVEVPCAPIPRGLYQLRSVTLRRIDLLSLFAVVLEYRDSAENSRFPPLVRVLPVASAGMKPPVPAGLVAGVRGEGLSRRRSEELIEARPYHPGDDTRRINWKAYAHSETLFVRIGEEMPPPSASADMVIDTRGLDTSSHLDQLISAALGVAEELERRVRTVTVVAQVDEHGSLLLGSVREARRALAAADPVYGFLVDPVPAGRHRVHPVGDHALVVTTGRSPAAPPGTDREIVVWDHQDRQGEGREHTIALLD